MGSFLQILKQKSARFYIRQKLRLKISKSGKRLQHRFVLLNVPSHGNLGDHLIAFAEIKFFQDYFNISPLVFTTGEHEFGFDILKKSISPHDVIFISGGGYLGSEWPNEEKRVKEVLENFPHNKIFIFPQTIYYANTREGREMEKDSARIYIRHPNLLITLREEESYKLAKESMRIPEEKLFLSPDMAFYLQNQNKSDSPGNGILFCIRQDKESIINSNHLEKVINKLKDRYEIAFTDTQVPRSVSIKNERKELKEKLKEFAQAKVVVTDKLHGMIMAILSLRPVIILDSKTHKVCNVWQSWMKTSPLVSFAENPSEIPEKIERILENQGVISAKIDFSDQFEHLAKEIKTKAGNF